jgi:hypothetical protein
MGRVATLPDTYSCLSTEMLPIQWIGALTPFCQEAEFAKEWV